MVGANLATVNESYSYGQLVYSQYSWWTAPWCFEAFGALIGGCDWWSWISYDVNSCYWNNETSGYTTSFGGEARTTDDMSYPYSDSTYVNWDFTNVWLADSWGTYNSGYPFFRWQAGPPRVYFKASVTQDFAPLTVQFNDKTQSYNNGALTYLWNFGDGETSTLQNPSHEFQNPGLYTISLTVTNAFDSTATFTRTDYIHAIERVPTLELQTSPSLNFGSICTEEFSEYFPVTFTSIGGASVLISDLHFLAATSQFEILQPLPEFTVPHGQNLTLLLRFAPQSVGAIVDTLYIVNNSLNEPILKIRLSGTGLYIPPKLPQNVAMAMNGYHAYITWDPVTQNTHDQPLTPDYYFVYYNGSQDPEGEYYFHGLSTTPEYTHYWVGLGAQNMFYRVTAVQFYRDDLLYPDLNRMLRSRLREGLSVHEVSQILSGIQRL